MSNHSALIILFGVFLLAAVGIVNTLDKRSEANERDLYCDMVQQFKDTNGQYGWPAYKGEKQCQ